MPFDHLTLKACTMLCRQRGRSSSSAGGLGGGGGAGETELQLQKRRIGVKIKALKHKLQQVGQLAVAAVRTKIS